MHEETNATILEPLLQPLSKRMIKRRALLAKKEIDPRLPEEEEVREVDMGVTASHKQLRIEDQDKTTTIQILGKINSTTCSLRSMSRLSLPQIL